MIGSSLSNALRARDSSPTEIRRSTLLNLASSSFRFGVLPFALDSQHSCSLRSRHAHAARWSRPRRVRPAEGHGHLRLAAFGFVPSFAFAFSLAFAFVLTFDVAFVPAIALVCAFVRGRAET